MELFLNHNFGKVIVSDVGINKQEYVAVNTADGMQHIEFKGFISPVGIDKLKSEFSEDNVIETSFFGSSGFRESSDFSWTFCRGGLMLKAIKVNKSVFCCIDNNDELVFTKKVITKKTAPRNVFNLF
jgi:hypothetical protein